MERTILLVEDSDDDADLTIARTLRRICPSGDVTTPPMTHFPVAAEAAGQRLSKLVARRRWADGHFRYAARGLSIRTSSCDARSAISVAPCLSKWALSPSKVRAAAAVCPIML